MGLARAKLTALLQSRPSSYEWDEGNTS